MSTIRAKKKKGLCSYWGERGCTNVQEKISMGFERGTTVEHHRLVPRETNYCTKIEKVDYCLHMERTLVRMVMPDIEIVVQY